MHSRGATCEEHVTTQQTIAITNITEREASEENYWITTESDADYYPASVGQWTVLTTDGSGPKGLEGVREITYKNRTKTLRRNSTYKVGRFFTANSSWPSRGDDIV
ncbi:AraC family transcriptional regulator [Anopheles sinensis]|uniref:AraC family transcriptional regulator n=1 Tax=Anopheles sinensis TaxID=74873 RepID=A0A084WDM7_ANOSI|nr:AraC family transcriptional regulator [Anopheles sinensis]